jgi:TolB-like protein
VAVREGTRVLVLAFERIGGGSAGTYDWIGRAVQQNLVTELGRARGVSTIAPAKAGSEPATEVAMAVAAGKEAGADVVVFGSFTVVEQDLRLNGQVVDVKTGEAVGTLKSTGTVRDLFAMEDTVATQVKRLVSPPVQQAYRPADLPLAIPAPPAVQVQQQPVQQPAPVVQPAVMNTYATDYNRYTYYPQTYGYPAYGYGWGGGWGGSWGGYCGGYYPVAVNTRWVGVSRTVNAPIGVGTSAGMVASGMISVANYKLPK